ncbi:hypothetical protein COLO4_35297 [Corchorus olitorius]|uniref:Uncharacterized protein n=1 Tax=Corchorus olitorius TaxID=93759 RepID=A0A1R3GHP8_9ROSI|nr:hypothetical protein COLO4_35297 [Corchorus olitorius]
MVFLRAKLLSQDSQDTDTNPMHCFFGSPMKTSELLTTF